jgi:aspartate carbamoyltransferase catalytic subunit
MGSLLRIGDLSDGDLDSILARAGELHSAGGVEPAARRRLVGLVFLEPSLRTRVGFAAAAGRLGWPTVEIQERRHSPTSMMESWPDTLRTVAGWCDVIVARPGQPLTREDAAAAPCPVINGGDAGPDAEHPTQALLDLFAMERIRGPVATLRIAVVGDPRMRAARSLLTLLARRPPAGLVLVADDEHADGLRLPAALASRTVSVPWEEMGEVDVVYLAGIPHQSLPLDRRDRLLATARRVNALPPECVLLSPMPVIDEMDQETRRLGRNKMFAQSDLGLFVRIALLEFVTGAAR